MNIGNVKLQPSWVVEGIIILGMMIGGYAQYQSFKTHVAGLEVTYERRFTSLETDQADLEDEFGDMLMMQARTTTTLDHLDDTVDAISDKLDRLLDEMRAR